MLYSNGDVVAEFSICVFSPLLLAFKCYESKPGSSVDNVLVYEAIVTGFGSQCKRWHCEIDAFNLWAISFWQEITFKFCQIFT